MVEQLTVYKSEWLKKVNACILLYMYHVKFLHIFAGYVLLQILRRSMTFRYWKDMILVGGAKLFGFLETP
jgi:hypothetical protein